MWYLDINTYIDTAIYDGTVASVSISGQKLTALYGAGEQELSDELRLWFTISMHW